MRPGLIILLLLCWPCRERQLGRYLEGVGVPAAVSAAVVSSTDINLSFNEGYWYFKDTLYSGIVKTLYPSGAVRSSQCFFNGREEGCSETFYPDGMRETKRYYHSGEKDGVHQGWWDNGNARFEIGFAEGLYDGEYKEWYQDGSPSKLIVYRKGEDISGKGWRNNGRLYMNFVTRNGRRYGMLNSSMCYSLRAPA